MVDIGASGSVGGFSRSDTVDFIAQSESTNATLLYVVPPLVLVLTGIVLASHLDARDIGTGVVAGAPVTIGYGVVMGLGAVVTEASSQGSVFGIEISGSMAPELVPAIVLAGVLYPLVFATAGAVLAADRRSG